MIACHITFKSLHWSAVASLHTQALCRRMDVSAGARWWQSSLYTRPPPRAPTAWCSWPHFNDLNHLRSTATHFRGLTEFILVDRDQCPQPWTLPDYSRGRRPLRLTRLDTALRSDFTSDPAALTPALGTDEWNGAVEIEENATRSSISPVSLLYRCRSRMSTVEM